MIQVRSLEADEGALLKRIRLHALSDSPWAFSSSLAAERSLPDEYWRELVAGIGQFMGSRTFVAERDMSVGAMLGCYPETTERYRLVAVWVSPEARRQGVGAALLRSVKAWVLEARGTELIVGVFESNTSAIAFYQAQGFELMLPEASTSIGASERELQFIHRLTE